MFSLQSQFSFWSEKLWSYKVDLSQSQCFFTKFPELGDKAPRQRPPVPPAAAAPEASSKAGESRPCRGCCGFCQRRISKQNMQKTTLLASKNPQDFKHTNAKQIVRAPRSKAGLEPLLVHLLVHKLRPIELTRPFSPAKQLCHSRLTRAGLSQEQRNWESLVALPNSIAVLQKSFRIPMTLEPVKTSRPRQTQKSCRSPTPYLLAPAVYGTASEASICQRAAVCCLVIQLCSWDNI